MTEPRIILHSIIIEEHGQIQVSYHRPDAASPTRTRIVTDVIKITPGVETELIELVDAAEQLLVAAEAEESRLRGR